MNPTITVVVQVKGATAAAEATSIIEIVGDDSAVRSLLAQAQDMADSCTDMLRESLAAVDAKGDVS